MCGREDFAQLLNRHYKLVQGGPWNPHFTVHQIVAPPPPPPWLHGNATAVQAMVSANFAITNPTLAARLTTWGEAYGSHYGMPRTSPTCSVL